jgi:hypothetical protein
MHIWVERRTFALAVLFMFPAAALAQLPKDLERCLPYPTYQEEIRDMLGAGPPWKGPLNVAFVESVELLGGETLSTELREQIVALLLHREFDADSNWRGGVAQVDIRGLLQDHGYFKAVVHDAETAVLSSKPGRSHVAVTIRVEEGRQYRLAGIRFASHEPQQPVLFSHAHLRARFPIADGELLVVSKLREGLEGLKQLYGSNGYIDFVSEPHFEFADERQEINVLMYLSQGPQFRIGQVEFHGLPPEQIATLLHKPVPGEIFDNSKVQRFFAENQPLLRCTTPENLNVWRDVQKGTLRLEFHIETCAQKLERLLKCLNLRLAMLSR